MAVELANVVHAIATLNLANVADDLLIVKTAGVKAATRASAGVYSLELDVPLDIGDGIAVIQHAAANSRIVSVQIQALSGGPANVEIRAFTDAGVAADTGEAYLVVYRYPVG